VKNRKYEKNHPELKIRLTQRVLSSFLKIRKGKYAAIRGKKKSSLRNLILSTNLNTLKIVKKTTAIK
jgi:hypothetical protein